MSTFIPPTAPSTPEEVQHAVDRLLDSDPYLKPYENTIRQRLMKISTTQAHLTRENIPLADFASGHEYFGLHFVDDQWIFREWAPNADEVYDRFTSSQVRRPVATAVTAVLAPPHG